MILGFDEAFAPAIVAGTKIHTIRVGQRWQAGEVAHFCVHAGQPNQREFWEPQPVQLVQDVELTATELRVDDRLLPAAELLTLAQADGFPTTEALLAYFADKLLPFRGQLVHWTTRRY
ncbi:ASCH domain-containing protein [Hymenobacter bucti]|uniref:ASCH domain-containing protein n=1 Tax=Hymenobacter bucti TaxID=1844114 RepID=A0ABW4QX18_9BACT